MTTSTLLTTLGRTPQDHAGVVNPPIYRASTLLFPSFEAFEASQKGQAPYEHGRYLYGRSGTPATYALEEAFAKLDGMEHAIITSSGLSAIIVALTGFLSKGDHLLASDNIYGSMRQFCTQELSRYGVEVTYYDPMIGEDIQHLMRPNTKMVYCESPGSLTFEVQDVRALAKAAHARGAVVAMDNTWATPLFLQARDLGVDIIIHSATKYIGGHSDLIMGVITCDDAHYGPMRRAFRNFGACSGGDDIYLAGRGLRTLGSRLRQHEATGLLLAQWCKAQPQVTRMLHPAFPDCPGHAIWRRDFTGASGLFSVLLKPYPKAALAAMINQLELFGLGYSWGGYESLLIPFSPERSIPWTHDGLCLRINAGLEDPDDLIRDLEAAFAKLN